MISLAIHRQVYAYNLSMNYIICPQILFITTQTLRAIVLPGISFHTGVPLPFATRVPLFSSLTPLTFQKACPPPHIKLSANGRPTEALAPNHTGLDFNP